MIGDIPCPTAKKPAPSACTASFATKPEKVYRAFLDADAMAKWLPPYGFTCKVHHMDAKVGGTFKMSFTNFTTGKGHSFGGEYLELVPNERLRYTDKFDDPNLPGEMHVTVKLKAVSVGTEVHIEQSRHSRAHSHRGLLSRLAAIAHPARPAGRAGHSGIVRGIVRVGCPTVNLAIPEKLPYPHGRRADPAS